MGMLRKVLRERGCLGELGVVRVQAANLRCEFIGGAAVVDQIISSGQALGSGGLRMEDGGGLRCVDVVTRHQAAQLFMFR